MRLAKVSGAAIIVGNPKGRSRTLSVAESVMRSVIDCLGRDVMPNIIDLCDYAGEIFDWESNRLGALTAYIAQCDLVVAASPTYKATYTGLLKAFLDRYETNGLAGVVVVPVMVGASPIHALAPEVFLRPLFVELGATVPSRALYILESQLDQLEDVILPWATSAKPLIKAALTGGRM
jgi:FMN reductase